MTKLSIIIPCYFNELNIPVTSKELIENEKLFNQVDFEYVFVDDGSKDNTVKELLKFKSDFPSKVKVVKLAGNVGAFNAVLAGMKYATGDCNVVMAADLQDPVELIPKMYEYWQKGFKLVVGRRADREDSFFQKLFSNSYHFLIRKFALKNIPPGGFDFVLFDKLLREQAVRTNEKNTNTLYLLAWMNFEMAIIPYTRKKRKLGTSKWTLSKKIKLLIDSFVSFSYVPVRLISIIGLILGASAFAYGIIVIAGKLTGLIEIEGWTSLMIVLLFVSSFQMIALGILGEYMWRTLDSVRKRPIYIVEDEHL